MEMMNLLLKLVYTILDKYDKSYSPCGVMENLNEWKRGKGWLVELLRRHPNWDEEAMAVIFDVTLQREIDSYTVNSYKIDLLSSFDNMEEDVNKREQFHMAINVTISGPSKLLMSNDAVTYIQEEIGIPCCTGQKTSRIINKICQKYGLDKHPDYNALFARLADSLSPLEVKRKALLSVHPCDYLEMSNEDNSWNSCHCLDDGCYMAGTLSYMNDDCSMIFYTVDEDIESEFYKEPKRTRQVFCYSDGILLQSRLYPVTDDEEARDAYRNIVQRAISECLALPNHWTLIAKWEHARNRIVTHDGALHYPDYDYPEYKAKISLLKGADLDDDGALIIGNTAYCLECSHSISESGSLYCARCSGEECTCCACGTRIDIDDAFYIEGDYYCDECCSYCDHCHEYVPEETALVHTHNGDMVYVCRDCKREHYSYCKDCHGYYPGDMGGFYWYGFRCNDCLSQNYIICETCGEYVRRDEARMVDDKQYCGSCSLNLTIERVKAKANSTQMVWEGEHDF